ncbi:MULTISPECIES: 2-oxoglutarate dehydrogenase complex dihydrolipoyllysine-residue succinyltransferase [Sphingobium]|uniref:Dihydrolipoyllysine-residue succinyltransferase component of 2-oxoglutarate dehydrogenase complex n=1 Tax=Sphingobium fuliginis (strain ATCC 27551) TaxID=336203 RepID=A0ABQ1ER94_SPHSA|nr:MULTISPECIES: 2-oxoglutarate dehydrogenase complex dihydrolipoyllysine-residue succinyltransferase [Sphingobium]RYL99273.1 2-oxoglutarate dehydrogenase complex dihydrolipoyllysine-residue succinyltransferase [Sphingobium fuliginis]WDA36912.1 2-oxoglutarate dehydrogenase complex dihydrolipoyllysine-residue succinyltransferase [Sphingobium sp. YC-XJ3]GFZ83666.1 dihydrolipoyllysine-residue succinyltransferase component of 2-oxoglutarate dehydrogenase complex [Sphingobium fuliginis]
MATEVKVPTLGESVTEATVGQWLKKPGDAVKADEPIVSLETDKVAVDVPAPAAGTLGDIVAKEGDTVEVGALLAYVNEGAAAAAAPAAAPAPAAKAEAATPAPAASVPADEDEGGNLTLSPAVRRLVLEHGLDPSKIKGTGKDGRLTKDDVVAAAAAGTAKAAAAAPGAAPAAAAPAAGPSRAQERVKMTRLRQTVAKRLKEAQNNAALLTTYNDVDMTNVIEARAKYKDLFEKKHGVRLGFMGFFTKAVCMALRDIPGVNAQIEGDEIVYNDFADISVAVSAPNGLVVPVIRNAESLSVAEIEKTIGSFGKKAKEGTLTMEDMKGGTFTISNGGVFGSLLSSPIINPPQSAVLGLHRIEDRPVVRDGQIVIRPMMYLALSYDHRLIDGREAVTFLVAVKNAIEDPTRLLIDL